MTVKPAAFLCRQSRIEQGVFPLPDSRIRLKTVSSILSPIRFRAAGNISGSPFPFISPSGKLTVQDMGDITKQGFRNILRYVCFTALQ